MPDPRKYGVAKAIGRATKTGVRRAVAPTKNEQAKDEAARINKQQAAKRAEMRKARAKVIAAQPKKPKPKKSWNPLEKLIPVLGGKKKD